MNRKDYETISRWIESEIGLHLEPKKMKMMDQRLGRLIKREHIDSVAQLALDIENEKLHSAIRQLVIDALVTNETQFFRGEEVYNDFQKLIREKLDREPSNRINVWSAAASTGQEPYSIAMIFEKLKATEAYRGLTYQILATDVSRQAIDYAERGRYSHYETQRGLNIREIIRWFEEKGTDWLIDPTLRNHIRFDTMNLLKDRYPTRKFDVIFLRHVLIYYEAEVRHLILENVIDSLADGGFLILGGTEGIEAHKDRLHPVETRSSRIYQKSPDEAPDNTAHSRPSKPMRTLDEIEWPFVG